MRTRIAIVKQAGMTAGGTERWLQSIAASLPSDQFQVTYFWSDAAEELGTQHRAQAASLDRRRFLEDRGVHLVEFSIEAIDARRPTAPWIRTNFWDLFDSGAYDIVQTAKRGPAEYPFESISVPVFEIVAYQGGVDHSRSIVRSCHPSEWSRSWWWRQGGPIDRSFVARIPADGPSTDADLREDLGIDATAVVVGFHQRSDDRIFSSVQLDAVGRTVRDDVHLVVLGGSRRYKQQAEKLGLTNTHFLDATTSRDGVSRFLNTLDLFVHGRSDGETFGLAIAEAMRHGLPCLSHTVLHGANGHRETIGPGGLMADDVHGYGAALVQLVEDAVLRRDLGAAALVHANAHYSEAGAVAPLIREYESFMAGQHPPRHVSYGSVKPGVLIAGAVDDPSDEAATILTGRSWVEAVVTAVLQSEGRIARALVSRRHAHLALALQRATSTQVMFLPSEEVEEGFRMEEVAPINATLDPIPIFSIEESGDLRVGMSLVVRDLRDRPIIDIPVGGSAVSVLVSKRSSLSPPAHSLEIRMNAMGSAKAHALRFVIALRRQLLNLWISNWTTLMARPLRRPVAAARAEFRCALRRFGLSDR